jgi:SAM-dependent methyltransferase
MAVDTDDTPYRAMAAVYDRWMEHDHAPYEQWCSFIDRECRRHEPRVADLLEIGCGTGTMTAALGNLGYHMTGVDASPWMLARAREKLGESIRLVQARMPTTDGPELGTHDGAICCFDTANYMVEDGQLSGAFRQIAAAIKPGGIFIVDANTEYKFASLFGNDRFGDDLDGFAYLWRSRYDAAARLCELRMSFFVAEGALYRRSEERHVQRAFRPAEVVAALTESGFAVQRTTDDYTDKACSATTQRMTWVARLE